MTTPTAPGPMQLPDTWSATAGGYAELAVGQFARYAEEALRLVPPAATHEVLDIGCGPGTLTLLAARSAARVTAIDFSPGMLEQLAARAIREGVQNVEALVMDAQGLELPDEGYDAAYSMFVLMFVPDRAQALREMLRVLRPGGRALVATWAPIERRPFMKVGFEAMAEAFPEMPPPSKGDLQAPDECERELAAAGFASVACHAFSASVTIDSPEHYLAILTRSGAPLVALRRKLGEQAWPAAEARLLAALRARLPAGATALSAEALLTVGTRPA